jgi:hypothetical protein
VVSRGIEGLSSSAKNAKGRFVPEAITRDMNSTTVISKPSDYRPLMPGATLLDVAVDVKPRSALN